MAFAAVTGLCAPVGPGDDTVTLEQIIRDQPRVLRLQVGMPEAVLREALGPPAAMAGPALWIYFPVRASGRPGVETCNALVVHIRDGRVALMRLTDVSAVRAMLERMKHDLAGKTAQAPAPLFPYETAT